MGSADADRHAVAIFVNRYPVLSETFVAREAEMLAHLGHPVTIEARHRPEAAEGLQPRAVDAHWVARESRRARLTALLWLATRHPVRCLADRWSELRRPRGLRGPPLRQLAVRARRLAARAPVHVHTHFATAVSDEAQRVARLVGASTSLTAHAFDIYLRPGQLPERLRRSDFCTSGCDYTVADLRAAAGPAYAARIHRQVMSIDAAELDRAGPLPGTRHVVAIGRLVEKKGFDHLVAAAAAMPDVQVSIAGEGPARGSLGAQIARTGVGDRVTLLGACAPDAVRALLERADLLCMPCVVAADGDRDSMPVVVKEAMAMRLCVVVSDEVGLPELVEPPWGRLVPPGDAPGLAAAILELLAHGPQRRAELGELARAHVRAVADLKTETEKLSGWIAGAVEARVTHPGG